MNKYEFIKDVAQRAGVTQAQAENIYDAMQGTIKQALSEKDKISLKGFGVFKRVEKAARKGVNPATRETVQIPAKVVPTFKFSKEFTID